MRSSSLAARLDLCIRSLRDQQLAAHEELKACHAVGDVERSGALVRRFNWHQREIMRVMRRRCELLGGDWDAIQRDVDQELREREQGG